MFKYGWTQCSWNRKTGRIPVSISPKSTCPESCKLKGHGCYAEFGPLAWRWDKVNLSFEEVIARIYALPAEKLWRHNQAGDLPGTEDVLDEEDCLRLCLANQGKRGWTYTHYPLELNLYLIQKMNAENFVVNASCDTLSQVDQYAGLVPLVVLLPSMVKEPVVFTPEGREVDVCPSYLNPLFTCVECQWCVKPDHRPIGFPAHGIRKRTIDQMITEELWEY